MHDEAPPGLPPEELDNWRAARAVIRLLLERYAAGRRGPHAVLVLLGVELDLGLHLSADDATKPLACAVHDADGARPATAFLFRAETLRAVLEATFEPSMVEPLWTLAQHPTPEAVRVGAWPCLVALESGGAIIEWAHWIATNARGGSA